MFKKEPPSKNKGTSSPADFRSPAVPEKKKGFEPEPDVKAYFDAGIRLEGKLIFDGTARIDGQVVGEIFSKNTVIIGEKARIEAQIEVNVLIVSGQVQGNVKAKQLLHLKKSGKIFGDILTPSLIIEEGGVFEGKCQMDAGKPASPDVTKTELK
jgi:cytoskeletal protein CcmA (bactofilin family)